MNYDPWTQTPLSSAAEAQTLKKARRRMPYCHLTGFSHSNTELDAKGLDARQWTQTATYGYEKTRDRGEDHGASHGYR